MKLVQSSTPCSLVEVKSRMVELLTRASYVVIMGRSLSYARVWKAAESRI